MTSSNYDPFPFWEAGMQMVALNFHEPQPLTLTLLLALNLTPTPTLPLTLILTLTLALTLTPLLTLARWRSTSRQTRCSCAPTAASSRKMAAATRLVEVAPTLGGPQCTPRPPWLIPRLQPQPQQQPPPRAHAARMRLVRGPGGSPCG